MLDVKNQNLIIFYIFFMYLLNLLYQTKNMSTYIKFKYCIVLVTRNIENHLLNIQFYIISILTSSKYIDFNSFLQLWNYYILIILYLTS